MNKLQKFMLVGSLVALVVEFHFKFLATFEPGAFIFTLFFYPIYLFFVYFANEWVNKNIPGKKGDIIYYIVFGIVGLGFEWFMNNNSPWANPQANQLGMFVYWVALTFIPRIFLNEKAELAPVKAGIKKYLIVYGIVNILVGVLLPQPFNFFFIVYIMMFAYIGLNYFYWKYLKIVYG
ncbi:MAG: hypothetical protein NUV67_00450 [archaeon]|nr:hypothetical protein [archaeon]